jgi:GT2 family glycosyltransferase
VKRGAVPTAVPNVWCTELELAGDQTGVLTAPSAEFDAVRVLVRFHGDPVDFVDAPLIGGKVRISTVVDAVGPEGVTRIAAHRAQDESATADDQHECLAAGAVRGTVTVVVPTRNRPLALRACLRQLRSLDRPGLDFVIVDNAPDDDSSELAFLDEVSGDVRFRYVREPRPGVSCARNRGLAEATGDFLAYVDDDVRVDASWVNALVRGFTRASTVACVTGLVCTASLSTAAEHYFDGKVSWSDRCDRSLYNLDTPNMDALYPYAAGLFGAGASMAFRTESLRSVGGFDEALGVGSKTAGGEDLDIFVRIIRAGLSIAYEPAAVVWHTHRSDFEGLRRQMFGYGAGLTAFITKNLLDPNSRRDLIQRIPKGVKHMVTLSRESQKSVAPTALPSRALLLHELRGMAAGPVLYLLARRAAPAPTTDEREVANAHP